MTPPQLISSAAFEQFDTSFLVEIRDCGGKK
jgi:hypothetical protein